jgi:hypothetical protein
VHVFQDGGKPIKAWIDGVELEDSVRAQLVNISKIPFIFGQGERHGRTIDKTTSISIKLI